MADGVYRVTEVVGVSTWHKGLEQENLPFFEPVPDWSDSRNPDSC